MAKKVNVKIFGKLHMDSQIKNITVEAGNLLEVFEEINRNIHPENGAKPISHKDAYVYVNGDKCSWMRKRLKDNDEIWLITPTLGG